MVPISADTRCYTRLEPRLRDSVFCGAGYSCVKITQVSSDWRTAGHVTTLRASDWLTSDHAARSDVRPVRLLRGAGTERAPSHPLQGMLRPRPSIRKYNHNFIIFVCGYVINKTICQLSCTFPPRLSNELLLTFCCFLLEYLQKFYLPTPLAKTTKTKSTRIKLPSALAVNVYLRNILFQDFCFTSRSGLEYCWCSSRDLCNTSPRSDREHLVTIVMVMLLNSKLWR